MLKPRKGHVNSIPEKVLLMAALGEAVLFKPPARGPGAGKRRKPPTAPSSS
jgi:hypothetical protein